MAGRLCMEYASLLMLLQHAIVYVELEQVLLCLEPGLLEKTNHIHKAKSLYQHNQLQSHAPQMRTMDRAWWLQVETVLTWSYSLRFLLIGFGFIGTRSISILRIKNF